MAQHLRAESLVGRVFGRWTVVSEIRGRKGSCHCRCECGQERDIFRGSLVTGASQSCGCARHPNLIGQRFGRLVAIELVRVPLKNGGTLAGFLCQCDCGKEKTVISGKLASGYATSCGCGRKKRQKHVDTETGEKPKKRRQRKSPIEPIGKEQVADTRTEKVAPGMVFGHLTVIREIQKYNQKRYECLCSCGGTTVANPFSLYSGRLRNCKCRGVSSDDATFKSLVLRHKENAKARNLDFTLTSDALSILYKQECFYCGAPPGMVKHPPTKRLNPREGEDYIYNGLDRVDNAKGYIPENVVASCWACNRAKRELSTEEFLDRVFKIAFYKPLDPNTVSYQVAKGGEVWGKYLSSAKNRHLVVDLTKEQAMELFGKPCHYCGDPPNKRLSGMCYTGIDRVDNSKGYSQENCVPCCKCCNRMKSTMSITEFTSWVKRVVAFQNEKKRLSGPRPQSDSGTPERPDQK